MKWKLEPQDEFPVEAAEGGCVFHDFAEAGKEAWQVCGPPAQPLRALELRWRLCATLAWWEEAYAIATVIALLAPEEPLGRRYLARSLVKLGHGRDAFEALRDAALRFPDHEPIRYDIVCLGCALGRWVEAEWWLADAIEIGGERVRRRALEDVQLEPLWPCIAEH